MNVVILLLLAVMSEVAAAKPRQQTSAVLFQQPHTISSADDTLATYTTIPTIYLTTPNNNTDNTTTTCSAGTPWHGADTWALRFQSPRAINGMCYIVLLPFVIWQGCLRKSLFRRNRRVLNDTTSVSSLYYLLAISFTMRAMWLFMEEGNWCTLKDRDPTTHSLICPCFMILRILNRLSMLTSFSAFSVIAIFWAEIVSSARAASIKQNITNDDTNNDDCNDDAEKGRTGGGGGGGEDEDEDDDGVGDATATTTGSLLMGDHGNNNGDPVRDCCNPKTLFMMLNVWVYIIEAIVLWMQAFDHYDDATYNKIRDYNYICVSLFFLLLTVAMLCIGRSMIVLVRGVEKIILSKMSIIMITCAMCFTLRSIILIWQPISGDRIPSRYWNILYPTFVYPVPELVPALVVLITMAPKKSQSLDEMDDEEDDDVDVIIEESTGCCCCGSGGEERNRRWLSSDPSNTDVNSLEDYGLNSLLTFDSVSSTDSINGGNGNSNGGNGQMRSRGWF